MTGFVNALRVLATPMILLTLVSGIVLGGSCDILQMHAHEDGGYHAHTIVGNGHHHDHAAPTHDHGHAEPLHVHADRDHHDHGDHGSSGHWSSRDDDDPACSGRQQGAPAAAGESSDEETRAASLLQLHLARSSLRSAVSPAAQATMTAFACVPDAFGEAGVLPAPRAERIDRPPAGTRVQSLLRCNGSLRL